MMEHRIGDSDAGRFVQGQHQRLQTLDLLRGLTLVSMILYHGMWDFIYMSSTGVGMESLRTWYEGSGGHLWQQSICRTFILLSGFCVPFSRRIFRRGLQVSGCGLIVSAVTLLFMYEDRIIFGVLTFLGAAMLLSGALESESSGNRFTGNGFAGTRSPESAPGHEEYTADRSKAKRWRYAVGLAVCLILFYMTRWINKGEFRLFPGISMPFPAFLYQFDLEGSGPGAVVGYILTAAGFTCRNFFSTDYFSLIPWWFLFRAGVCLNRLLQAAGNAFDHPAFHLELPVLNLMGRHSLLIYMLHQPVLYVLVSLLF